MLQRSPILARAGHTAVWTGTEMVVWAGHSDRAHNERLADFGMVRGGGRYAPANGTWRKTSLAPIEGRSRPITAWTGSEMIVFGGGGYERGAEDGARYDPASDRWAKLPRSTRPFLSGAVGVWTGSKLLMWGGSNQDDNGSRPLYADGIAYERTSNSWSSIPRAPIQPRTRACGVWTGTSMIVWGGFGSRDIDRGGYSSA